VTPLKPCPFGCTYLSDVALMADPEAATPGRWWYVECGCCMCRGPWSTSKERAAELWNIREDRNGEPVTT
jgi:hypothetical protein